MKQEMSLLVENHQGVLSRIARLFDGRDYRLESLTTEAAEDPETNRITLVVSGAKPSLEKVRKQLDKLVDVIQVEVKSEAACPA
jgi:acetolactate synthase I/III small subunit